jgi:hypothetical protein
MIRTTVMASEELVARLRAIAREEGLPLAEVIRQGLEERARMGRPRFSFAAAGESSADAPPIDWNRVEIAVPSPRTPAPEVDESVPSGRRADL